jgi:crotonobetainyl-CoA:carnitine CoA-transferase CaiB-like acyl-CoA transferase
MTDNTEEIQKKPRPLEGIRIVEYAIWHAGPGASAILGDMGAEVIKIETFKGDPERPKKNLGSIRFDEDIAKDWSFLFELSNRNKKGICLDIETEKGRDIFHRLIKRADVFLTNLRNSTKPKLGIDYQTLSRIHPKIIHASVSGFGLEGPMKDTGAFDSMGQAISGMMFLTNNDEPIPLQTIVLDQMTAITASHAILSALLVRELQGISQEVHVSLYSSALWLTHANLLRTSLLRNRMDGWKRNMSSPLRNCYRCKDGNWIMGNHNPEDKYWPKFCELIQHTYLLDDPRYADEFSRMEHGEDLIPIIDKVFLTRTRNEWMELFLENGFMFAPVHRIDEVLTDPQALANDYLVDFDHPIFGTVKIPGFPVTYSANRVGTESLAPKLGEHTVSVLQEIGYDIREIESFQKASVVK